MTVVVGLLALVVALLVVLVAGLLRTNAEVMRRLDALGAGLDGDPPAVGSGRRDPQPGAAQRTGRSAADLSGATLDGGTHVVRVVGTRHDSLLLFLSSGCLTCRSFFDALRDPAQMTLPPRIRPVVVVKDLQDESPSALAELAPPPTVPLLFSTQAWTDYAVPGSPYAVLVAGDEGRIVGEGTGTSWDQVAALLAQASGDLAFVGGTTPRTTKARRDMTVERDTDAELLAAGIRPGDVSLYPDRHPPSEEEGGH